MFFVKSENNWFSCLNTLDQIVQLNLLVNILKIQHQKLIFHELQKQMLNLTFFLEVLKMTL